MKVQKVASTINEISESCSFTIMGDPGCDGLGAEIMSTFAKALSFVTGDFGIILGDVVPFGMKQFYRSISRFIDTISPSPIYLLCGNHDTEYYSDFFGLRDYMLVSDRALLVILNNWLRVFSEETLDFLSDTLKSYSRDNILLLFHIPPPNRFAKNSINQEEWEKMRKVYYPHRKKIKYFLSGHVHTFFEDQIDGIKLIVSAGAGARLELIDESFDRLKTFHHVLKFSVDSNNNLSYSHITLDGWTYEKELEDEKLRSSLVNAFQNECLTHVKYLIYAKNADEKGFRGLAKLYRAIADGEFHQARNHFHALGRLKGTAENLKDSLQQEYYEAATMYRENLDYARSRQMGLSSYAFHDAIEAEKVHHGFFQEATSGEELKDMEVSRYFTCTSCGHTFRRETHPANCPICGAPPDKIREVI